MHLANYLGYLHKAETNLAEGLRKVGEAHAADTDIYHTADTLAKQCEAHAEALAPFLDRYGEEAPTEPDRLFHQLFDETRQGGLGLLRDLHDLYLMANACDIAWTMIGQAAQGARDVELLDTVTACERQTAIQIKWLKTRMKQAAPQALLAAS
ncbi:hypothetical protein GBA65_02760 [Rubrobacter marinus]|uniref:Uncharacterized protein n=1 Tax=Rubrobacter marinus TaxID=2653852 RepID=A0A6G8PUS0_9ACTN|nr:hypothetical protein [Rubrobacter marinus]QIN77605.1 hypothetical protein GBA65_02760 [Rubrobacter marinus]